jgi:hypothetical protein
MVLKDGFDSPNFDTCTKLERGYCSSTHFGEKPLLVFQNSFFFPRIALGKQVVKTVQKMFFIFILGKVVFRTPLGW